MAEDDQPVQPDKGDERRSRLHRLLHSPWTLVLATGLIEVAGQLTTYSLVSAIPWLGGGGPI
ncbi:hypothetical protein [Polymorphospora sp. NPDC050346]|uniref:hypothetical protein n=1 Tax=Polymorphospora sp. NPDC050346 TaxID=3155780 RepID=UPI0033D69BD3